MPPEIIEYWGTGRSRTAATTIAPSISQQPSRMKYHATDRLARQRFTAYPPKTIVSIRSRNWLRPMAFSIDERVDVYSGILQASRDKS